MLALLIRRIKVLSKRLLASIGLREDVALNPVAVLIGMLTACLAVAFHGLIEFLKHYLYESRSAEWLYGDGLWMLVALPAAGGLLVGLVARYIMRAREGHGVVDVIESVMRTRGFVRPVTAIEKILTSAITIGSGGSCGAEGPIVQIGAAVSSGVGRLLSISRLRMPLLIGCGVAAGISSIFHAPIGGVLFTLEIILRDFSVRTFVPVVVASVVANVTTQALMGFFDPHGYQAIFWVPGHLFGPDFSVTWSQAGQFALLGLMCGLVGVMQTKLMLVGERAFAPLKVLGAARPMVGGAILGLMGVLYVIAFSHLLHQPKPIPFEQYPMPAFYSDGYGVIQSILQGTFAMGIDTTMTVALLIALIALKLIGTAVTLCSGGSGGVIAPSLVLGATSGLLVGIVLRAMGVSNALPEAMALVGMGAVLAAVVHAPLASILIVFELTQSPGVIVPAMLTVVVSHGMARLIFPDSVYTTTLRQRGLAPETADMSVLRKFAIDQLPLLPILPLRAADPIRRALDLSSETNRVHFVVTDPKGNYAGLLTGTEIRQVLLDDEAIPLLTVGEVMRTDVRPVRHTDNLADLFEKFVQHDIEALPVGLDSDPNRTIGIVTRDSLMKQYQKRLRDA